MDIKEIIRKGSELFLPNLSIEIAVIGFQDNELKILLLEFDNKWMLPGGYIYQDESVDDASKRILFERTGLHHYFMKIFQVFGSASRSFPEEIRLILEKIDVHWSDGRWMGDRFISTAFYALVDINQVNPNGGMFSQTTKWCHLKDLPDMWFDHKEIGIEALKKLKEDVATSHHSYNMLPEKFTMPELHQLQEQILEKKLDRSRFQKKMLSLDLFERLPEPKEGVPHRRPFLYKLKK